MTIYKTQRFNRWTILSEVKNGKVKARCDCGIEKEVTIRYVTRGLSKSCGCYRKESCGIRSTTHGFSRKNNKKGVYNSWIAMKRRCRTKGYVGYHLYGGRGISYDPRWESFENFLQDMGKPPIGTSLDRIDNNGNYCKENCRWATRKEQSANTRWVKKFILNGEEVTIRILCDRFNIKYKTLYNRIHRYSSIEKAVEPYLTGTPIPCNH